MSTSLEEFYGRSVEINISANLTVDPNRARLWFVNATVAALEIRMPDATSRGAVREGGPVVVIVMQTGSNTITVTDNGGTSITLSDGTSTLAANQGAKMLLLDDSTVDGSWAGKKHTSSQATNPTPTELLYVAGGVSVPSGADNDTEEYNHQVDTWTDQNDKSVDCSDGGSFRTGANTGVWFGDNGVPRDAVDRYTASTNVWLQLTDRVSGWQGGQCGGNNAGGSVLGYTMGDIFDLNETREYSDTTEIWSLRTDKNSDCQGGCADGDSNGDIFVLNGSDTGGNTPTLTHERYRPSNDTWLIRASQPSPEIRDHSCVMSADDELIRLGGFGTALEDDVDIYDVEMDGWVSVGEFPLPAGPFPTEFMATGAPENKVIVCAGQRVGSSIRNETYEYIRATDAWVAKQSMTQARTNVQQQGLVLSP